MFATATQTFIHFSFEASESGKRRFPIPAFAIWLHSRLDHKINFQFQNLSNHILLEESIKKTFYRDAIKIEKRFITKLKDPISLFVSRAMD